MFLSFTITKKIAFATTYERPKEKKRDTNKQKKNILPLPSYVSDCVFISFDHKKQIKKGSSYIPNTKKKSKIFVRATANYLVLLWEYPTFHKQGQMRPSSTYHSKSITSIANHKGHCTPSNCAGSCGVFLNFILWLREVSSSIQIHIYICTLQQVFSIVLGYLLERVSNLLQLTYTLYYCNNLVCWNISYYILHISYYIFHIKFFKLNITVYIPYYIFHITYFILHLRYFILHIALN